MIDKRAVSSNKKLYLRVRREISNLKKIRHANVVEIHESESVQKLLTPASKANSHGTVLAM